MKTYKPTSPARRQLKTVLYRDILTTDKPEKSLTKGVFRSVGRNNQGRITTRHKGGGNKRLYRDISFLYDKKDILGKFSTIEYDPNRSAFISLVVFADGEKRYMLSPKGIKAGDTCIISETAPLKTGNALPLRLISVGTFVYNIETKPGSGAKLVRSAGNYAQVVANDSGYTLIKMPSSEIRKISENCYATIGEVSNEENKLKNFGKAGRSRWKGIRPTVRGSAMNPVDHPYGGGEGAQGRGTRRPKTKWGKITGGRKTRTPKKYSNYLIVSRRSKKKKK